MIGMTPHEIDLAGTDGGMHARLAQALEDAARYIRTHTDLPIPADVEISYHVHAGTDKAGEDELFRIAAMLGAHVTGEAVGYARKDWGPVRYSASYITRRYHAEYDAHMAPFFAEQRLAELRAAVAGQHAESAAAIAAERSAAA
jgi:hypothetical protein